MRYCASGKFEIIRLIEQSNLSVRQYIAAAWYPKIHFLQLVAALSIRWHRWIG